MPRDIESSEGAASASEEELRLHRRLSHIEERIRTEFEFISSRTGWLFSSHAFLFTALATLLSQLPTTPGIRALRSIMMLALPAIGVSSSYVIWRAILGAYYVVEMYKDLHHRIEARLAAQLPYDVVDVPEAYLTAGDRPPQWLPLILGSVWLLLLLLIMADVILNGVRTGNFGVG